MPLCEIDPLNIAITRDQLTGANRTPFDIATGYMILPFNDTAIMARAVIGAPIVAFTSVLDTFHLFYDGICYKFLGGLDLFWPK